MLFTIPSAASPVATAIAPPLYTIHDPVKSGEMRGTFSHRYPAGLGTIGSVEYTASCRQKKAVQSKN